MSVNIPALPPDEVKGYRFTRHSTMRAGESFERREDPRGNVYFWPTAEIPPVESDLDVDVEALRQGYVSITPLFYDLTAHSYDRKPVSLEAL